MVYVTPPTSPVSPTSAAEQVTVTPFAARRKLETVTVTVAVALAEPDVAVIVAVPSVTEVTRPADDTVAMDELDVVHVTVAPDMVLPTASFTVAASVAVSERDAKLKLVGASVIDAAVSATEIPAVPVAEPDVAVIVADPVATPVTSPADDTVATDELDVVHVTDAPDIVFPTASFTVAASVAVSPNDVNDRLVGDSVTVEAAWDTVTVAVALREPDVAVIVAVPLVTEVTRPADDTVAMDELDVVHVTGAPDMVLPTASFTVAASVAVSESDAKLKLVGASVIDAAV